MTEFDYQKQAQSYYAKAPVLIIGSGASIPFGLPSMTQLADHIKDNTDTSLIPPDQTGNWSEFCGLLESGVDLEQALHQVNFSQEATNISVQAAWELINSCDEAAYKQSLIDRSTFPLGKLLNHMFRTSLSKIDIITTNYDCLIEYACDQEEAHYYNGFSYGHTKRLSTLDHVKCSRTANIWKVHGSIDWFCTDTGDTLSF